MNFLKLVVNSLQYQPCHHSVAGYLILHVKYWARAMDCGLRYTANQTLMIWGGFGEGGEFQPFKNCFKWYVLALEEHLLVDLMA